jgi:hypothetical protein
MAGVVSYGEWQASLVQCDPMHRRIAVSSTDLCSLESALICRGDLPVKSDLLISETNQRQHQSTSSHSLSGSANP